MTKNEGRLVTPDDADWIDSIGKASIPTTYSHLDNRFRVNHFSGRRAKDIMDRTLDQMRRLGTSPNKLVLETLGHKPEVWQQIMEDMSVVFCNDERTHTPDDMKVVLGIVLRELNEIPNDKKRDYHRIMIRCLTKYLVNNTQGLSLDQCFGMTNVRSKEVSPHAVPPTIFNAVNQLVFYNEDYPTEDEPYPTLVELHKGNNEERQEQWCEENGHDWFEYKRQGGKYPDGVNISKSAFDRQFNKYKFVALNEILRDRLTHKPHKIILSEKQRKQIHKYWDKIDFPEVVEYLDKDIFK